MRGANPVRAPTEIAEVLEVQEIFSTIQGEGPFTGVPAIFVRVAGCNLRCHFCDTDFESSYQGDNCQYVVDVAKKVMDLAGECVPLCVVTGGEPFRQGPALASLIYRLCRQRMHVQIETAGTLWCPQVEALAGSVQRSHDYPKAGKWSIVCSPKTPKINHAIKREAMAFKYILSADDVSPLDGLPLKSTQKVGENAPPWRDSGLDPHLIYIQPMDMGAGLGYGLLGVRNTQAAVEVVKKYGYTLSLQTHKIIGLP